jgi:hypothetical protein
MTRDLRDRLRDAPLPAEHAARERAWRVVKAAYAGRGRSAPRSRRRSAGLVAAGAAALAAVVVALTPPGDAVGRWVRGFVRPSAPAPAQVRPALGPLPGHGRLLVTAPSGAWLVQADGTRRRLGAYTGAALSPHGLFVAATRGNLLAAVDPHGRVRWTLTRPGPVTRPAWSPDGFRVAYRSGAALRVVYGDGALDRQVARDSAPVTPAWRPGSGHRLASVARDRRVVVVRDTDSGRVVWRARVRGPIGQLAWSPSGRRLLVVTGARVTVLSDRGRTLYGDGLAAGLRVKRVAWLPGGRGFAVLRSAADGTRSDVVLAGGGRVRRLIAVAGRLSDVVASPDGRWLLLSAPDAQQWLLVRTSGSGRLTALSHVGRQFDPGGRGPAALPHPEGWIG